MQLLYSNVLLALFAISNVALATPSPRQTSTGAFPVPTSMTLAQQQSFQVALVNAAAEPANQDMLASDVQNAVAAAVGIAQNFTNIGVQLQEIDGLGFGTNFSAQWSGFRTRYINILTQSKNQASSVAQYATDFETFLGFITNPAFGLNSTEKIQLMQSFANETTTFQTQSDTIMNLFDSLSNDLLVFTGQFASFAKSQLKADNGQIIALEQQIAELQAQMAQLQVSMIALGAVAGGVLLGSAIGIAVFPEAASAILIGAAIVEGLIIGTEIGLATTYAIDGQKVNNLNNQVNALQAQIGVINAANSTLTSLAQQGIPTLADTIALFTQVWSDAASDAGKIAQWVEDGENLPDVPPVLAAYFNTTGTPYAALVSALTMYATTIDIPSA